MQINQIPQLSQLNTLQGLSNIGGSDSKVSDSSSIFQSLLEQMVQNTSTPNVSPENTSVNSVGGTTESLSSKNAISGLNSLSIDPQKLMQMMLSSQNTNSSALNIGTDSSDDDSTSDDISIMGNNDSTTQMINSLLQTAMQNQGTNASNTINPASIISNSKDI